MSSAEQPAHRCAWCRRRVQLRGASPQGRICSNCCAARRTGRCGSCGRVQRLVGLSPAGQHWCERCKARSGRSNRLETDTASIIEAVAVNEPHLHRGLIERLVSETVPPARARRRVAQHLNNYPEVLTDGPTHYPYALERLARALQAAGAETIAVRMPECAECGRHQRPHMRIEDGWLCGACHQRRRLKKNRNVSRGCATCGTIRRAHGRDQDDRPLCRPCKTAIRRQREDEQITGQIIAAVGEHLTGDVEAATLTELVGKLAPRPHDRRRLAADLQSRPRHEHPRLHLARLIRDLSARGASGLPTLRCTACSAPAGPDASVDTRGVFCRPCTRTCPGCGKPRADRYNTPCRRCRADRHRLRGTCTGCGKPARVLDTNRRCRWCRETATKRCTDCGKHTSHLSKTAGGICHACLLIRDLEPILPESIPEPLLPLRTAILHAEPLTTRRWLTRGRTMTLLTGLACGEIELSHTGLDTLHPGRDIDHLRDLLVTSGALPADPNRPIDQLRSHLNRIIDDIAESDRPTVTAWMSWQVLPKLRRDIHQRHIKPSTAANTRNTVTSVVAFLFRLAADGRSLAGCRQNDIDSWFAIRQASRHRIRPFLRWSQKHHHLNRSLTLPPHRPRRDQAPADAEHRWDIAHRLITDDTLDPADRIAGGLLVLFAQPLARIVALSTTDISHDNGKVTIAFDTNQIELPEPFAALTNQLPHQRRRSTVEQLPTTWLFPGSRAGRHITPTALARRLRRLGIDPRPMRNAALTQLAAELPPTILASTLGITPATAVRWTTLAAGNWTRYAPTNN